MPAPSPLKIATQAVSRLVKEENYYQKELSSQTARIEKLETDLKNGSDTDSNAEFMLKQEVSLMFLFCLGPLCFYRESATRVSNVFLDQRHIPQTLKPLFFRRCNGLTNFLTCSKKQWRRPRPSLDP
jgi:hypothetical protein